MSADLPPRHCTDPAIHGPHTYADDTDMRGCPGTQMCGHTVPSSGGATLRCTRPPHRDDWHEADDGTTWEPARLPNPDLSADDGRRLRAGRKVHRTLYEQCGDASSDDDQLVGMVDTPELATEIVAAVNTARSADDGRDPELERLRELAATLSGAVWTHPDIKGGAPCVGGTRVPVDNVTGLMVDVAAEDNTGHYSGVTPEGARAAAEFADRYVDRHMRDRTETDPRTEVSAHWGGDPERIVSAWEADRAALVQRADDEAEAARSARQSVLLLRRELDQARADLDAATQFAFPNGVTVSRQWDDAWRVAWPSPDAPGPAHRYHPLTEHYPDRTAALDRARQIAGEDD